MKLWILAPQVNLGEDDPWEPWYDKCFGMVVRAPTEEDARALAHSFGCDENSGTFSGRKTANTTSPWTDPKYSVCVEVNEDGPAEVIIQDIHHA